MSLEYSPCGRIQNVDPRIGMGTLHGWEKYGDGATPDIQAVAKGLGGGYGSPFSICITQYSRN